MQLLRSADRSQARTPTPYQDPQAANCFGQSSDDIRSAASTLDPRRLACQLQHSHISTTPTLSLNNTTILSLKGTASLTWHSFLFPPTSLHSLQLWPTNPQHLCLARVPPSPKRQPELRPEHRHGGQASATIPKRTHLYYRNRVVLRATMARRIIRRRDTRPPPRHRYARSRMAGNQSIRRRREGGGLRSLPLLFLGLQ